MLGARRDLVARELAHARTPSWICASSGENSRAHRGARTAPIPPPLLSAEGMGKDQAFSTIAEVIFGSADRPLLPWGSLHLANQPRIGGDEISLLRLGEN
jgi:hypothetical protein